MLVKLLLAGSLAVSPAVTGADIAERVQPDLDTFVFCVLDESVERLDGPEKPEEVAELAAAACQAQLEALEQAVAAIYREVNAEIWPAGLAERTAAENAVEYRRLAVKSAVKIIVERRSAGSASNDSSKPTPLRGAA